MKNFEQSISYQPEQEKRAQLISRYIETKIVKANKSLNAKDETEVKKYYEKMSAREKADILYGKLMAYAVDKQAESERKKEIEREGKKFKPEKIDPYFISEIKILIGDSDVKELFSATYAESRVDAKKNRLSELGNLWNNLREEIKQKETQYKELEKDLYLGKISGQGKISSAKSRMGILAENLSFLEKRKKDLETLKGFSEIIENTNTVANFQYERLKEYQKQLKTGFIWLPSRRKIHQETVSAILNHRWPVLIGEAGSGKSQQADAAAMELTGYNPTEIECEATTGEKQLVIDKDIDPETGGSYDRYGALMQAFTGYEDSRQKKPSVEAGRIVRFDESGRLGPKAYSIIKKARQKGVGDDFYGHPVLSGAGAIWTSNPVGPRYPDRHAPDPAMRRELAEIYVDYPEMSVENPELYEFALSALLDENQHISAIKQELAPAYEKKEIPEDKRQILEDGSVIVAKDELITNMADPRHGALWRFNAAIKALQDSFVYGNAETEKYPDTLLRFKEDADGNIEITDTASGEPLTLSTSTITLGELASWMSGFNERRQKQEAAFRTDTLTEWLNFKINTYLKQADKADKEKIRAIFGHFGFLDKSVAVSKKDIKPLTPKEIGYLSPSVPRPVYVEKPIILPSVDQEQPGKKPEELKEYETKQVLFEDGARVLIREKEISIDGELVKLGEKIRIKGEDFSFAGIVEDKNSLHNGKPVGKLASGEELYGVFNVEELNLGILTFFKEAIAGETGIDDFKENIIDYWEREGCKEQSGGFVF